MSAENLSSSLVDLIGKVALEASPPVSDEGYFMGHEEDWSEEFLKKIVLGNPPTLVETKSRPTEKFPLSTKWRTLTGKDFQSFKNYFSDIGIICNDYQQISNLLMILIKKGHVLIWVSSKTGEVYGKLSEDIQ